MRVSIDLIRHPEKDDLGRLTESGKQEFEAKLLDDLSDSGAYDTVKFYVSPLHRGQESKEPMARLLETFDFNTTTIRNKRELIGKRLMRLVILSIDDIQKILSELTNISGNANYAAKR